MNCVKCHKRVKTPKADYSVSELVAMCRGHCLACNPEQMPRGGGSQVLLLEDAIGYATPGNSVDETGEDDAPSADNGGEPFQHIHPDYQNMRTGGQVEIGIPENCEPYVIELLKRFAALDIRDVDILHGLLNGMSCADMARAYGYKSRQMVHVRLVDCLKRNQWMKEMHTRVIVCGLDELRHSSPSWQGKTERPFTRGRGVVLADVPGADPDTLAEAVDGGKRKRRIHAD